MAAVATSLTGFARYVTPPHMPFDNMATARHDFKRFARCVTPPLFRSVATARNDLTGSYCSCWCWELEAPKWETFSVTVLKLIFTKIGQLVNAGLLFISIVGPRDGRTDTDRPS
jgi:hypothetical protein